jgi:hypothetical protein
MTPNQKKQKSPAPPTGKAGIILKTNALLNPDRIGNPGTLQFHISPANHHFQAKIALSPPCRAACR